MSKIKLIIFLIVILVVLSGCSSKEEIISDISAVEISGFVVPEFKESNVIDRNHFSANQNNLASVKYTPINSINSKTGISEYALTFSTDFDVNKNVEFITSNFNCVDKNLNEYETNSYFNNPMDVTSSNVKSKELLLSLIVNDEHFPSDLICDYNLIYGNPRQAIGSKFFLKLEK